MEFVDRKEETRRLEEALSLEKSVLVVVYGRRRLGKSTLIKRVLREEDIYFLADRSEGEHQRELLAKMLGQKFPGFDKVTYHDWESMLLAINYRTKSRFTLCLDELPYLVEQSPELPSVLQKLVDSKELKYNLILCGSSQHMMYGLFLDSTAPLYGRAEEIIKLKPIRIPFLKEAIDLDATNTVEEYAVWGGVPRYWELREHRTSMAQALWRNIFSVNAPLYEEPEKLLQDDVKDIVKVSTVMSYIGSGACRLSEIAARCNEPATNLSRPLKKLIDLGFLERELPFGVDVKNSKKSLYKIADPFLAFYYQFVVPNRSFIQLDRHLPIEAMLESQFSKYVGMQWEKICRDAVTGNVINNVLYGRAERWWGSVLNEDKKPESIEIDVVSESLDKQYLLVGECKWTAAEHAESLLAKLVRKAKLLPFATNRIIMPVLFLKSTPIDFEKLGASGNEGLLMLPEDVLRLSC
ncbi:MAG: ATP-binding protein [Muribaculaceae bacterium]|nr:ATP-binding protein [Muribaculaceae bacterium]